MKCVVIVIVGKLLLTDAVSLAGNVLQISEGTNSVGFVRLDLGFCLCAVMCWADYKTKT